jgi:hypothetical protein
MMEDQPAGVAAGQLTSLLSQCRPKGGTTAPQTVQTRHPDHPRQPDRTGPVSTAATSRSVDARRQRSDGSRPLRGPPGGHRGRHRRVQPRRPMTHPALDMTAGHDRPAVARDGHDHVGPVHTARPCRRGCPNQRHDHGHGRGHHRPDFVTPRWPSGADMSTVTGCPRPCRERMPPVAGTAGTGDIRLPALRHVGAPACPTPVAGWEIHLADAV